MNYIHHVKVMPMKPFEIYLYALGTSIIKKEGFGIPFGYHVILFFNLSFL